MCIHLIIAYWNNCNKMLAVFFVSAKPLKNFLTGLFPSRQKVDVSNFMKRLQICSLTDSTFIGAFELFASTPDFADQAANLNRIYAKWLRTNSLLQLRSQLRVVLTETDFFPWLLWAQCVECCCCSLCVSGEAMIWKNGRVFQWHLLQAHALYRHAWYHLYIIQRNTGGDGPFYCLLTFVLSLWIVYNCFK